jgi:hypothetical protein
MASCNTAFWVRNICQRRDTIRPRFRSLLTAAFATCIVFLGLAALFAANQVNLGIEDPMTLYKRFRGRESKVEPLLKRKGFLSLLALKIFAKIKTVHQKVSKQTNYFLTAILFQQKLYALPQRGEIKPKGLKENVCHEASDRSERMFVFYLWNLARLCKRAKGGVKCTLMICG